MPNANRNYRDPHLHHDCPVSVIRSAWPEDVTPRKYARMVEISSTSPDKAWIVAYHYGAPGGGPQRWVGEALLIAVWGLRVSRTPMDPPPLPEWAQAVDSTP